MVDQEVEDILKQIRATVLADEARTNSSPLPTKDQSSPVEKSTSDSWSTTSTQSYPNISTMNRAWDRLPPVISNRRGAVSSLELWLKRIIKRGSRWFTWEQVNFNAAVHHTFREIIQTLTTHEQQLASLKAQLSEVNGSLLRLETSIDPHKSQRRQLSKDIAELSKAITELRNDQEGIGVRTRLAALEIKSDVLGDEKKELQARMNESLLELRESTERILDEQRVCFKQIALETSEASAHDARERRALTERITKLEDARVVASKATNGTDS